MLREFWTKPMPLPFFTDLTKTPPATRWSGCLCIVKTPGSVTTNIADQLLYSDGINWIKLNDTDASVSGTSGDLDQIKSPNMPTVPILMNWELVVNSAFQGAGKSASRPWLIPSFNKTSLPNPANWQWCLLFIPDPKSPATYTEKIVISNGTDWLAIDGGNDALGGSASIGSRPNLETNLADLPNFNLGWDVDLQSRFTAWENAWTFPMALPFFTKGTFYELGYGWRPDLWKWCLAVVTDAGTRADEFLIVSNGVDWKWLKDNTNPIGDLSSNLESWWKLEESSGSRVDDAGANDLTDNNTVTRRTGIQGFCASFDKANSEYLSITDNASLSFGDEALTISVWVKLTTKTSDMGIVGKWDPGSSNQEYLLAYSSALGKFVFQVSTTGSDTVTVVGPAPVTGTWYHIVAQHDPTANMIAIRTDHGTPVTKSHSGGIFDGAAKFIIGAVQNGLGAKYNGLIDEVGIWRRVLTGDEISTLYNSGSGISHA